MLPTIEACWDWAQRREDMNAPFDFFVFEDAHQKAIELISPLEDYFLNNKHYVNIFYNTYLHYCITTDYRVEYEKVWAPRPLTPLDTLPMTDLTPSETKPSNSIPMTDLTPSETKPSNSIPMTDLTPSEESIPIYWTPPSESMPMNSIPMTDLTDAQRWVINTMYKKYDIENNSIIYNSVSDGSSSTSAQMFSSLNDGDFLMSDLIRTPYGLYVYRTLEQMNCWTVLL